jgi:hypothetical protein
MRTLASLSPGPKQLYNELSEPAFWVYLSIGVKAHAHDSLIFCKKGIAHQVLHHEVFPVYALQTTPIGGRLKVRPVDRELLMMKGTVHSLLASETVGCACGQ